MRTLVRDGHVLWSEQTGEPRPDQATLMRRYRDAKLRESDWTQIPDAPISQSERAQWAKYRQDLRDVPQGKDFPDKAQFPDRPGKK